MELKQFWMVRRKQNGDLLIVPYGIETKTVKIHRKTT